MRVDSETLDLLIKELARALEISAGQIGPDSRLAHLPNIDSLRLMDVVTAVEDALGTKVDEDELVAVRTVAQLAAVFPPASAL